MRLGIGFGHKLAIAFLFISGFSLAAALVGIIVFRHVERHHRHIDLYVIPAVVDAQSFARESMQLTAAPVILRQIRDRASLRAEIARLHANSHAINHILDGIEAHGFDPVDIEDLRQRLKSLRSNVSAQAALVDQRLRLGEQQKAASVTIAAALREIPAVLDQFAQTNVFPVRPLAAFGNRLDSLRTAVERLQLEIDADEVAALQRDYTKDIQHMTRLTSDLSDSAMRAALAPPLSRLRQLGEGADSIFAQRTGVLATERELQRLDAASRETVALIGKHAGMIVMAAEQAIERAHRNIQSEIAYGQWLLIGIAIAVLCMTIFFGWRYVFRNIVRRLNRLAAAMRDLAGGNLAAAVTDAGADELGDMARALDIFRQTAVAMQQQGLALKVSEERFALAAQGASVGIWEWRDVSAGAEYWSPMFYKLLGFDDRETEANLSGFLSLLHPDDRDATITAYKDHLTNRSPYNVEIRMRHKSGDYRWFNATGQAMWNDDGEAVRMAGSIADITEQRQTNEQLAKQAEDLRRSNSELEQFAYVASHDLQEPLRMVSSYCALLNRRYGGQLDGEAQEFIAYAVDGARRMQLLINDLLRLSRVGRTELHCEEIDLAELVDQVARDLGQLIADTGAEIHTQRLPSIRVDRSLFRVVIQNLTQNAIKFRGGRAPMVTVTAEPDGEYWRISLQDNGIGIDPKFADRVFEIFQRLQPHDAASGTGIGLAIAKRVVERHGGTIWLDTAVTDGACFRFTVLAAPEMLLKDAA